MNKNKISIYLFFKKKTDQKASSIGALTLASIPRFQKATIEYAAVRFMGVGNGNFLSLLLCASLF
jgi:hypothetical protein